MGIQINGNTDNISATDGGLTVSDLEINQSGISTFNGNIDANGDLDVDGHTELDNVNIAGVTTFANTARFSGGDVIFSGTNNFLQWDKSADYLRFMDGVDATFGNSDDLKIYHSGTDTYIANATNNFRIGNTGSTNLKFFTNNSTRWNIDGSGHFVPDTDSQVDIGTNSVRVRNIYADNLYGSGANLTGITGTTINNNANNRLITGSGTANTLEGESGLTFDGSTLSLTPASSNAGRVTIFGSEGQDARLSLVCDEGDDHIDQYNLRVAASNNRFYIDQFESGAFQERFTIANGGNIGIKTPTPIGTLDVYDGTFVLSKPNSSGNERNWRFINNNVAAGNLGLQVSTAAGGSSFANVLEITKNGLIGIGEGSPDRRLHLKDPAQIKLESTGTGNWSGLQFLASSGTNNYDAYMGMQDSDGIFFIDNNSNGHDFTIDRSGRVTTPSQPRFSAYMANTYSWNNQIIVWDSELYDVGNHYNTSNGKFTAPVAGYYVFGVKFRANGGFSQFGGMWTKNSSTYKRAFGQNSYAGGDCITAVDVIPMSANDTMGLRFEGSHGGATGGAHENGFWGYLLG